MMIKAMHGDDIVLILGIYMGSPKDCEELCIIYSNYATGVIGYETGDDTVLDNFVVIE